MIEAVPVGISITTPEGETIECNSQAFKILGYDSKEESLKIPVLNHYSNPEDRKRFFELAKDGVVKNFEVQLKRKDNTVIWASISSQVQYIENETYYVNSFQDITNRKTVEQNLKESEEKFRTIAEQSFMNIIIIQDGILKYFNERVTQANGYSRDEINSWKSNEFAKLIHPDDREFVMNQAMKKQAGEKNVINQYKYRMVRKDGEIRWLENFSKTIIYQGKPADLVMSIDIDDKIKAEQRLKESEKKYREAYNQADFYKDLFAHDMSNILQNVKSSIELSGMWIDAAEKKLEVKSMFELVQEQINRASSLIQNVRKLSSIDEKSIEIKTIDLKSILNNAVENIRARFPPDDYIINIKLLEEELSVKAGDLLIDVFENILINAAMHNENKPKKMNIKISKIQDGKIKYVKIEHVDNGIGIKDEIKGIIFNRARKKEKSTAGMGIGLSLVKKIIDGYGGKIWVEDRVKGEYSKGSNFIILLRQD